MVILTLSKLTINFIRDRERERRLYERKRCFSLSVLPMNVSAQELPFKEEGIATNSIKNFFTAHVTF